MKTASFNVDSKAWLSTLDQKVLSSWIASKSKPAERPEFYLSRPELLQRLDYGKAITWLLAPAGFGKTVLISEWFNQTLAQADAIGLWLSLDPKDNHVSFLLRHILDVVNNRVLGIANDALKHWQSFIDRNELPDESVLILLLDALKNVDLQIIIVLDDLHYIESETAWQVVQYLMTNLVDNVRLVFSSRFIPVALGRLRLDPKLEFIKQKDLVFNLQNTSLWLRNSGVDNQQMALTLIQRMQGWPAGLGLWRANFKLIEANAVKNNPVAIESPSNSALVDAQEDITDYLMGEVLDGLTPELKHFLISISPLKSVNENLCNEVLGIEDSCLFIQQLIRQNIFIEPLKHRSGWYVLHPLLSESLSQYHGDQQIVNIHFKAFNYLKQHGFRVEAIQHARLGKLSEDVIIWIESEVDQIIADLDFSAVLEWCDFVGENLIDRSIRLQLMRIWSWLLTYQYSKAEISLKRINVALIELSYPGQLVAINGFLARGRGEVEQARGLCELALSELPNDRFAIRALMCSTLSNLELSVEKTERARFWNRKAMEIARQFKATGLEVLALFDYARIELFRGHFSRSSDVVGQGLALANDLPMQSGLYPRARLTLYRAFIRWLQGDLEGAKQDVYSGIDEASRCRDVVVLYGYSLLSLMFMTEQKNEAALEVLDQAERLMQQWQVDLRVYQYWVAIVKANIWMSLGKWDRAAEAVVDITNTDRSPDLFPMQSSLYGLTCARLSFKNAEYDQAQSLLTSVINRDNAGIVKLAAIQLSAVIYRTMDEPERAAEAWQQGVELTLKGKIRLDFLQLVKGTLPEDALPKTLSVALDVKLKAQGLTESANLSLREKEVLLQIAEGYSNQEIADQLFISLHTVKTHARKINVKLGAKSRTQAIVRARALDII